MSEAYVNIGWDRLDTFVTNFGPEDRELYERAIALCGMKGIWIDDKPYDGNGQYFPTPDMSALHADPHLNLTDFWMTFQEIEEEEERACQSLPQALLNR